MSTKILVVDDEPDLELLITQKFRKEIREGAFSFRFAQDGEEALAVLDSEPDIDLVLSDINMPRMDGLTFLQRLAERESDLRAVIISAYGDMANIRTAMNRGAFDFIMKPIEFDDLQAVMRKTLAHIEHAREMRQGRERAERAKAALARYFSPNLAEQLAGNPQFLELGGERRAATFLFTDLADFTRLVESMAPTETVALLNAYLDGVTQIVFAHEGTVVKIVGDSIHAMFGAPLAQPDHAHRAVQCALAIDAFARGFEAEQHRTGVALGVTRIGINTGTAIVGNFGGALFFDYTAHGDAVNVASRLERVNKRLGTRICVSGSVAAEIAEFHGRPVGELILKGKSEALMAYEPLTEEQFASPQTKAYLRAYETLAAGDAAAARRAFAAYLGEYGDDPLATFHLQRLLAGECRARIELREK